MTHRAETCLNCGAPTPGAYCSTCGQRNADYRESMREIVGEVAQELFQVDSRIAHTLVPFLFRPGFLTQQFNAGRRTHYSSPLRIFLLLSVAFFFAVSLSPVPHLTVSGNGVELGKSEAVDGGVDAGTSTSALVTIDDSDPVDGGEAADGGGIDGARGRNGRADRFFYQATQRWARMGADERSRRMGAFALSTAPKAVFVLMPLFAVLLMALFRKTRRFYVEHLVFSVHFHSFVFLLLLVGLVLPSAAFGVLAVLGLVYLTVALYKVYEPTWWKLAGGLFVLLFLYTLLLTGALLALLLAALELA